MSGEECFLEARAAVSRQEHAEHVQGTVRNLEKNGWKVKGKDEVRGVIKKQDYWVFALLLFFLLS